MSELENDIILLKYPANVRTRPGMYIGSTEVSDVILREIIDNSIDELMLPNATNTIMISINQESGECIVADNGRGIPDKIDEETGLSKLELAMANVHAGGKFNKGKRPSIGMNGCGASCILGWVQIPVKINGVWKSIPISELVDKNGLITYSIDKYGNKIETPITKVWKTKEVTEFVNIILENGEYFECTLDHKLLLSNGEYKEAQYLTEDDDLANGLLNFNLLDVIEGKVNILDPLVYRIYNIDTNKSYIGITMDSLLRRFARGRKHIHSHKKCIEISNDPLYIDIRDKGIDKFKVEILCIKPGLDREDLRSLERFYVWKYNSYYNGYNKTLDGGPLREDFYNYDYQSRCGRLGIEKCIREKLGWYNPEFHMRWIAEQRKNKTGLFNPEFRSYLSKSGIQSQLDRCSYSYSIWLLSNGYIINEDNWERYRWVQNIIPSNLMNKLLHWKKASWRTIDSINKAINDYENKVNN